MKRLSVAALLCAAVVATSGCRTSRTPPLPVYHDAFLQPHALADSGAAPAHRIGDFSLTAQDGSTITADSLRGRIHVAQFFFAHCKTMCPPMFNAMSQVQKRYAGDERVQLVSFTLTPETDSVAALRAFAAARHLPAKGWWLLTGEHDAIRALARDSYFVGVGGEGDSTQHAGNLVLVDGELRVRGVYGVTHASETQRLIADIATLEKESR